MSKTDNPLLVRIYLSRIKNWQEQCITLNEYFVGFWMGLLKKECLHRVDQYCYDHWKVYSTADYNEGGLFDWELRAISSYFQDCENILIAGAGAGREVVALDRLGFMNVEGFECNPELLAFGNTLLEDLGLNDMRQAARDEVPKGSKDYDGVIIGWGAYMLIQTRTQRIKFLKRLRHQMQREAPLLLSFYPRVDTERRYDRIKKIANIFRWIFRRDRVELGDDLVPNFVHFFSEEEIKSELSAGGFDLVKFSTEGYGHAIAKASTHFS